MTFERHLTERQTGAVVVVDAEVPEIGWVAVDLQRILAATAEHGRCRREDIVSAGAAGLPIEIERAWCGALPVPQTAREAVDRREREVPAQSDAAAEDVGPNHGEAAACLPRGPCDATTGAPSPAGVVPLRRPQPETADESRARRIPAADIVDIWRPPANECLDPDPDGAAAPAARLVEGTRGSDRRRRLWLVAALGALALGGALYAAVRSPTPRVIVVPAPESDRTVIT